MRHDVSVRARAGRRQCLNGRFPGLVEASHLIKRERKAVLRMSRTAEIAHLFVQLHGTLRRFVSCAWPDRKRAQCQLQARRDFGVLRFADARERKLDPIATFDDEAGVPPKPLQRASDRAAQYGVVVLASAPTPAPPGSCRAPARRRRATLSSNPSRTVRPAACGQARESTRRDGGPSVRARPTR